METLPKEYRKNSYDFKLLKREGDVAMYEQYEPSNGRFLCYEVFVVVKQKEQILPNGLKIHEKEVTPSNSQWGTIGFSCWTLEGATQRFKELQERECRLG